MTIFANSSQFSNDLLVIEKNNKSKWFVIRKVMSMLDNIRKILQRINSSNRNSLNEKFSTELLFTEKDTHWIMISKVVSMLVHFHSPALHNSSQVNLVQDTWQTADFKCAHFRIGFVLMTKCKKFMKKYKFSFQNDNQFEFCSEPGWHLYFYNQWHRSNLLRRHYAIKWEFFQYMAHDCIIS